jgi:hypothetical protein
MIKAWLHEYINRFQNKVGTLTGNTGVKKVGAKKQSRIFRCRHARQSAKKRHSPSTCDTSSREGSERSVTKATFASMEKASATRGERTLLILIATERSDAVGRGKSTINQSR